MDSSAPSDARIDFRIPSSLKQEIERAARVQNRSITDFATAALTESARKVLAEHAQHEHVRLTDRDRDRFLAALDVHQPNAALKSAAKRHRKRVA